VGGLMGMAAVVIVAQVGLALLFVAAGTFPSARLHDSCAGSISPSAARRALPNRLLDQLQLVDLDGSGVGGGTEALAGGLAGDAEHGADRRPRQAGVVGGLDLAVEMSAGLLESLVGGDDAAQGCGVLEVVGARIEFIGFDPGGDRLVVVAVDVVRDSHG
jgi:hypothetical protein